MTVDPSTRRANVWLLLALIVFAVGLCALILFWMRYTTQKKGGKVYPPPAVWVSPNGPIRVTIAPADFSVLFC